MESFLKLITLVKDKFLKKNKLIFFLKIILLIFLTKLLFAKTTDNKDILINTIHDFLDKDLGTLLQKLPVSFEFFLGVHDPVCRYIPTLDRINTLGITMPVTTFHNSGHDILLSEPEQHNKTILAKVSQIKALQ